MNEARGLAMVNGFSEMEWDVHIYIELVGCSLIRGRLLAAFVLFTQDPKVLVSLR